MAASVAVTAFSTNLIWNYRQIMEILNISGPVQARNMLEVTSHDSDNTFKEYIAGVIDGGEITLEGNIIVGDVNGQVAFHTDVQGTTKRNAFIVMPMAVGASLYLTAFAKGFEPSFPNDGKISLTGSLVVSGKPLLLTDQATGLTTPFLTGIKDGGTNTGNPITITPSVSQTAYALVATIDSDTTGVKLTATCAGQTLFIAGASETSGAQTSAIACAAGKVTSILILCYTTATPPGTSPRVYILDVTRPS